MAGFLRAFLGLMLASCSAMAWASSGPFNLGEAELDDSALEDVTAQHGIVLNIYLRNNVTDTFVPMCPVALGTPNNCRLALEFADRPGIYMMLKEFYGTLQLNDIQMDAHTFPATTTAYADASRFQDSTGACLIPGKTNPNCFPTSTPALKLFYPAADVQNVYDDFKTLTNIGRVWLEFDSGGTFGYNRDTSLNSSFSFRIADSVGTVWVPDPENPPDIKLGNNSPALMRFWGNAYVFGF